jgi:hypothetical protein
MLAGAIGSDGEATARAAQAVAASTARFSGERARLLFARGQASVYVIEREGDRARSLGWEDAAGPAWLVGDHPHLNSGRGQPSWSDRLDRITAPATPGRWLAVRPDQATGGLRFGTDPLGLAWLYLGRTRSGYVFSSDFAAVATALRECVKIDYDAALSELVMGCSPGDSTIVEQISLAPAGAVFRLAPDGLSIVSQRLLPYGEAWAGRTREDKLARLGEMLRRVTADNLAPLEHELVLSISAGADSRYALAFLEQAGLRPPLCTFGHPESDEVRGARSVCARLKRETDVFAVPDGAWDEWRDATRALGNCGMTQWSGWSASWMRFLARHGRFPVIGYLGDALSGKHLGDAARSRAGWLDFWLDFHDAQLWSDAPVLRPGCRRGLQQKLRERFAAEVAGIPFASAHQQILHLDLYGRQRRWVATQPNLIQRHLTPVLFFYDQELMAFWCNLPFEDLLGQRLYRDYAHTAFPDLFPAGERRPASVAARIRSKTARLLALDSGAPPSAPRPPVIDHGKLILPNRGRILALAARVQPLAEPILDLDVFRDQLERYHGGSGLASTMLMRVVNLLLLLDLCAN